MDSYDDLTTQTRRAPGSQMLLDAIDPAVVDPALVDPEAVLLSIVDDQLIVSIPESGGRPGLLPEDYLAVADRPRFDDDPSTEQVKALVSPSSVARPERRSIARAQARSAGEWIGAPWAAGAVVDTAPTPTDAARADKADKAHKPDKIRKADNADNVIVDERLLRRPEEIRHEKHLRRRHRLGRLLVGLVTVGIIGAALYNSAVFRVTKVNVTGNVDMSDENIVQALAIADEPSMLNVKVTDLRQRLVALPLIADAQIWKRWPNTIEVQVMERFGVATVASPSGWIIIDQQGVILDQRAQRPNLPLVMIDNKEIDPNTLMSGAVPNPALTPALLALSAAPSKLTVLVDQVSVTNGEVTLSLRRTADDSSTAQTRPASGRVKAARLIQVNFGRAVDVMAKWKAIDTLRDRVELDKFGLIDVSVAGQPALVPTVSSLPPTTTVGGN